MLEDQRDTLATTTAEIQKYNAQIGQLELQKRKLFNGELSPITPLPTITSKVTTTSETGIIQPQSVEQVTNALYDQYDVLSSISSISSSIGSIFSSMGNETSSAIGGILQSSLALIEALMQFPAVQQAMVAASNVATTTQIGNSMAVIGAKQAESLASGTASAASLPFPANLAAIAGVIAAIVGIFSSIKSVGNFATGGIVGGSSFFGDRITANVNSGEMILNGRQQRQL